MAEASVEPDAAPTRDRILTAAATTLSTKGYAQTHLADIARLAQVQPPAVYYYFTSRDDLISAVMTEGQRLVREHVERALGRTGTTTDARGRVAAAVEAHLRVELERSDFARAVSRNAGQLPEHLRSSLDVESRRFHGLWRDLLGAAADEGALRPELDPGVARMLVIGALNWAAEWWTPGTDVDRVVEHTVRFIGAALFAAPGAPAEIAG